MPKTILKLLVGSILLIATQACVPANFPTKPNSVNTSIAQTSAAMTQTSEPGIPVTGNESPTPTPSPVPATATQTSTAIPLPTTIVTSTSATGVTQVSVSVPTNCRTGPGVAYERVGGLAVGQTAEVVGRNPAGNYWIIRNPNRPGELCWLWGQYANLSGDTSVLPQFTPPPSPTPSPTATPSITPTATASFTAAYNGLESCSGTGWWVDIDLTNNGGIAFRSMSLSLNDTVTNTVLPLSASNFPNRNGCNETDTRDNLPVGGTRIVSSPAFNYDPTGHQLVATVTLCSETGLNGACRTQAIQFTP